MSSPDPVDLAYTIKQKDDLIDGQKRRLKNAYALAEKNLRISFKDTPSLSLYVMLFKRHFNDAKYLIKALLSKLHGKI